MIGISYSVKNVKEGERERERERERKREREREMQTVVVERKSCF